MIICLWDRAGERAFLMIKQSRAVTLRLRPLCQKGHSNVSSCDSQLSRCIRILCRWPRPPQVVSELQSEAEMSSSSSLWHWFCVKSFAALYQLMISFYYGGKLMHSTVVNHSEGCRISPQQHLSRSALYSSDSMQSVHFPPAELIEYERQRHFTRKLLGHLERGVLVRANQEGIFIKRLCQSRVFWMGLTEVGQQYSSMPCKLERDAVVKIFDTGRFLQGALVCLLRTPHVSNVLVGNALKHLFSFASSSSAAVPGGSGSCSRSLSDIVFWRGAPRSQQRQEQTDHCAGETRQSHCRSSTLPIKRSKTPPAPTTDQRAELPAPAGGGERAPLAALLQQPEPGRVGQCRRWAVGTHLPGPVQLQRPPEVSLLPGLRADHCLSCGHHATIVKGPAVWGRAAWRQHNHRFMISYHNISHLSSGLKRNRRNCF